MGRVVFDSVADMLLRWPSLSRRDLDRQKWTTEVRSQDGQKDGGRRKPYSRKSSPVTATTRYPASPEYS